MKEYWYCIIGPTDKVRKKFPIGADYLLRKVVKEKYEELIGGYSPEEDYECASGWGIAKKQEQAMFFARLYPDQIIKFVEESDFRK